MIILELDEQKVLEELQPLTKAKIDIEWVSKALKLLKVSDRI